MTDTTIEDAQRNIVRGWADDARKREATRQRGALAWALLHKATVVITAVAGGVAGVAGVAEWWSSTAVGIIALLGGISTLLLAAFDPNRARTEDWRRGAEWRIFAEHCDDALALQCLDDERIMEFRTLRDKLLRDV